MTTHKHMWEVCHKLSDIPINRLRYLRGLWDSNRNSMTGNQLSEMMHYVKIANKFKESM